MKKNIWLDGMMGLVVGDALGVPVQFLSPLRTRKPTVLTVWMTVRKYFNYA